MPSSDPPPSAIEVVLDTQSSKDNISRKRKVHKKSREGCRNCKLRRVKCDENRPSCKKCTIFGVSCNYRPDAPVMQVTLNGAASINGVQDEPISNIDQPFYWAADIHPYTPPIISDSDSFFKFDDRSMERLYTFRTRTMLHTVGPKGAELWEREMTNLTCSRPWLMHTIQTLTILHNRYTSGIPNSPYNIAELCHHWSLAATLLNRKLARPIEPADRDALWASASLLGVIACSSIEAYTPEEAWPLKPSEPSDLNWLRMTDGKAAVWEVANPRRPDSIFYCFINECGKHVWYNPITDVDMGAIPAPFIQLFNIDSSSTRSNNPYYGSVVTVAALLPMECNRSTLISFFAFVGQLQPEYFQLLQQKDPRALLLLAYWYAKVCHSAWWMRQRATLECQAICMYLERYHPGEAMIQELLVFPKMLCMPNFIGRELQAGLFTSSSVELPGGFDNVTSLEISTVR